MKIIDFISRFFNDIYNKAIIKKSKVYVGNNVNILGRIKIAKSTEGFISIGNNVRINSGKNYNIIGGDVCTTLLSIGSGRIIIGNNTGISNTTIVAQTEVFIGDNVKIGGSTKIYDTDFHSINYENRMMDKDPDIKTKKVEIQDGAFIGAHTIILKGVTIGKLSVIGAGSVVTKSIPENEVWAGNPAVFIKKIGG